jgi:hypothetical protein
MFQVNKLGGHVGISVTLIVPEVDALAFSIEMGF